MAYANPFMSVNVKIIIVNLVKVCVIITVLKYTNTCSLLNTYFSLFWLMKKLVIFHPKFHLAAFCNFLVLSVSLVLVRDCFATLADHYAQKWPYSNNIYHLPS